MDVCHLRKTPLLVTGCVVTSFRKETVLPVTNDIVAGVICYTRNTTKICNEADE